MESISEAIESRIATPLVELRRVAGQAADAAARAVEGADSAYSAADMASSAADQASADVRSVEDLVMDLRETVAGLDDMAPDAVVGKTVDLRRKVWWEFGADTYKRTSARSAGLEVKVRDMLSRPIAVDVGTNVWEAAVWDEVRSDRRQQRGQRGTLTWWEGVVVKVAEEWVEPSWGGPDFPDLRAELHADVDRAVQDPASLTNQFVALLDD